MKTQIIFLFTFFTTIAFGQQYWNFHVISDSVEVGSSFKSFIEIDTLLVKDLNKILVYVWGAKVERIQNKFPIDFIVFLNEPLKYDIRIINNEHNNSDTTKFQRTVYGIKQKNPKPLIKYTPFPEIMLEFSSKQYSSFEKFILESLKEKRIIIKGKLILSYAIMADGNISQIQVDGKTINYFDKDQISEIIANSKYWNAGEDKGKKVNVPMQNVFDFK